jgi:hypothetical protein
MGVRFSVCEYLPVSLWFLFILRLMAPWFRRTPRFSPHLYLFSLRSDGLTRNAGLLPSPQEPDTSPS